MSRGVFWDFDGVIARTERQHENAFRAALASFGHSLKSEEYHTYFAGQTDKAGLESYLYAAGFDNPGGLVEELIAEKQRIYDELAGNMRPAPGVVGLMGALATRAEMGIVSSSSAPVIEGFLGRNPSVARHIGVVVTAEDIDRVKPDPQGILKAAEASGVDPGRSTYVGDTPVDIVAGHAAGMRVVAVTSTHTAAELADADAIVSRLNAQALSVILPS